jgi:hypothetical protein
MHTLDDAARGAVAAATGDWLVVAGACAWPVALLEGLKARGASKGGST